MLMKRHGVSVVNIVRNHEKYGLIVYIFSAINLIIHIICLVLLRGAMKLLLFFRNLFTDH